MDQPDVERQYIDIMFRRSSHNPVDGLCCVSSFMSMFTFVDLSV